MQKEEDPTVPEVTYVVISINLIQCLYSVLGFLFFVAYNEGPVFQSLK